jgi:hypothetical protein
MKKNASRQYTIRNIPDSVDRILRQRAEQSSKSFNQVVVEALTAGSGEPEKKRDLSGIFGSMTAEEADQLDEAIRYQRQVDPKMWE